MAETVKGRWLPSFESGLTRNARRGCSYEAYLPDPLVGRRFELDGEVASDLSSAERALVVFDGAAGPLADSEAVARLLLRAESVASSKIEGLQVGGRRLLKAQLLADLGEAPTDATATEILGGLNAMRWAVDAVAEQERLTVSDLKEIHRRLFEHTSAAELGGVVRDEQNWIGGSAHNPCSAAFVPPPPSYVDALLADLCEFCSRSTLPPVLQAAVAHAQFETIHPFADGNGRTGRALIHVVLRRRGITRRALAPISLVLATWSEDYVDGLTATRYLGPPSGVAARDGLSQWLTVFSAAARRAVDDAREYQARVLEVQTRWRSAVGKVRSDAAVRRLIEALPGSPVVTVATAAKLIGRSIPATNAAMTQLVDAGVVQQTTVGRRNRAFEARDLIDAFTSLERQLASPAPRRERAAAVESSLATAVNLGLACAKLAPVQLFRRVESAAEQALPGEAKVRDAAHAALDDASGRRGLRKVFPFLGPAFVAAVAYVDPGNFATNVAGGAQFGYTLLWVIVTANLMAMLVQSLSAKLGIATGRNLGEMCRERFPRAATILLWLQAEAIAIATDVAEFLGAALALNLLFGIPLFPAGILTAFIAFGVLALQQRGVRKFEAVIAGFVGIILLAFGAQVVLAQPRAADIFGGLGPAFDGTDSLLLAVGILGATVMPHVIYLHSSLTQHRVVGRTDAERRKIFRFEVVDVVIALGLAGLINASMLITAAAVLHGTPFADDGGDLVKAANALGTTLGSHADILFGIALLASGLSSSSVGTLAGQVIMQGFLKAEIPLFVRRAITMTPALVILAIGVEPTTALVISQVVLSFGIPFALVPLLWFCSRRDLMGGLVNRRSTTVLAAVVAAVIITLNVVLLYLTFTGA